MSARVSINQMIDEVNRELSLRAGAYPMLVAKGKLRQAEADFFKARLEAVRDTLVWLKAKERLIHQRLGG